MRLSANQGYCGENPIDIGAAARGFARRYRLTLRESDVLNELVAGASSKEAGRRLGISFRTVETHRANLLKKAGARSTPDLLVILFNGAAVDSSALAADGRGTPARRFTCPDGKP